ncbi:MAG: ribonuclease HII [Alphaproteobacteria bacterium]|nr:ribonuclease HII [Alphaproteobacteria bacterium]
MTTPSLAYEIMAGRKEGKIICGVDEVGRGPLAGPVVAAALIIPLQGLPESLAAQINDSKKLSPRQRESLFPHLTALCPYAVAQASVEEIDSLNILHASLLAMSRAIRALPLVPDHALIDGNKRPKDLPCNASPLIKGDGQSLSIAAASIIAKVTRDRIMAELDQDFPAYGWARNAGYGTAQHLKALETHGPTIWHRKSFAPVARMVTKTTRGTP